MQQIDTDRLPSEAQRLFARRIIVGSIALPVPGADLAFRPGSVRATGDHAH